MKTPFALLLVAACAVASAATEVKLAKTFTVSPGGSLVVEVDFGSVEVVSDAGRSEVSVDVWRKVTRRNESDEVSFLKENPVDLIQEGDTVTVRAQSKRTFSFSWFGFFTSRNEARYTIHVPEQFAATLKTSGGSISASGLAGTVKANTSGGSLRFTGIHGPIDGHTSGGGIKAIDCDGDVRISTSGGSINVSGGGGTLNGTTSGGSVSVKSFNGPANVHTSGGGLTLENIQGRLKGDTSGGSIHATLLAPVSGDVDLSTSGGGITLAAAPDAAFNLDAKASGGGVHCDLPVTVQGSIRRDHITGTVNGGGPAVHLHTSGGGIRIRTP